MIKTNGSNSAPLVGRLSDAALVLLSQAANRDDGMVLPPPATMRTRGRASDKVLGKLLRQALVEEVQVALPEQAWRSDKDGSRIGLRITSEGLKTIGVPTLAETQDSVQLPDAERKGPPRYKKRGAASRTPAPGSKLPKTAPVEPEDARVKPGTKQAILIERLSRPSGATLVELTALLGWQPHTVRAALTRLRQGGSAIARGKNEDGETIYRAVLPSSTECGAHNSRPLVPAIMEHAS